MTALRRAGAVLAVCVGLAACAGTDPDEAASGTSSSAASSPASSGASSSSAPATASGQTVEVGFSGGQVTGGGRIPVHLGTAVTLQVTSDVADEVHVHGYDLMADVSPDAPATITLDATVPGVFEVELEDLGRELLTLQVQ
jgi:heme/copper-type cytochrome/quinol oxidase subunit 2